MKFKNQEEFTSQELEFSIGINTYLAVVSYDVNTVGEYASHDYPAECETTIDNVDIESVEIWNEDRDDWDSINPSEEVKVQILLEIQKYQNL
jgi:hypothetical protein